MTISDVVPNVGAEGLARTVPAQLTAAACHYRQALAYRAAAVDAFQVYLRVIRGSGEPSKYDEFTGRAEESIARLKTQPGFAGYYAAGNRVTGSFLTVTIWETEEGANAPLQDIVGYLLQRVQELGAHMERPETFEVLRSS